MCLQSSFPVFWFLRRVPSREDRGFVQWAVPCDQKAGVGPFLHRVAMLGYSVSVVHTQTWESALTGFVIPTSDVYIFMPHPSKIIKLWTEPFDRTCHVTTVKPKVLTRQPGLIIDSSIIPGGSPFTDLCTHSLCGVTGVSYADADHQLRFSYDCSEVKAVILCCSGAL